MGHAIAGISCDDINIFFVGRIASDIAESIKRLHDLPRPTKNHLLRFRETRAGPFLELIESRLKIVRLSGLMIAATRNKNLFFLIAAIRDSHVMIWHRAQTRFHAGALSCVPKQRARDRSARDTQRDYVSRVRPLLRVNDVAIVDG